MMTLRTLHIATWYPTTDNPNVAPFIKAHFDSLKPFGNHRLIHVEVVPGGKVAIDWNFGSADNSRARLTGFRGPTQFRELLTIIFLSLVRLRLGRRDWDVVLVHVAWPTLRFLRIFRLLFGTRIVLIEHWSAYAKDFYLEPTSGAHARMRRMLSPSVPVVAVSESLANDIKSFAQRDDLDLRVVPNVVDSRFRVGGANRLPTILMAASWNKFRRPFLVLEAMPDLLARHPDLHLTVIGDGPQLCSMKQYVAGNTWSTRVTFLGSVSRDRVAMEMRQATLFAHPTSHETFSVVTAEAMCCGVPSVVSNVGAISEIVIPGVTGYLVNNEISEWRTALLRALDPETIWERDRFAASAAEMFSPDRVGKRITAILAEVAAR